MRLLFILALLATSVTSPARAQGARYRPAPDTLYRESVNPYFAYWVRGADTLGSPVHDVVVSREVWSAGGDGVRVIERTQRLSAGGTQKLDTLLLHPDGRARPRADGAPRDPDLFFHLPAAPLAVGLRWTDSTGSGGAGEYAYSVVRSYHVTRVVDTLGARLHEIAATGTVRYRDGWWADSAAGTRYRLDVRGPVDETFWFDVERGRMVGRRWTMDLRGTGSVPGAAGGSETLPAGMRAAERSWLIPADRARLLTRALPAGDTSLTVGGVLLLRHMVARGSGEVSSAMVRGDGRIGTARGVFAAGRLRLYEATWTDTSAIPVQHRVEVHGAQVHIRRGGRDTVAVLPTVAWAVADSGMLEQWVPVLLSLPRDEAQRPFTVYRPQAGDWQTGVASVRLRGDILVAIIRVGAAAEPTAMLITKDGDLLYAQNADSAGATRVPAPGSARETRVEKLLRAP